MFQRRVFHLSLDLITVEEAVKQQNNISSPDFTEPIVFPVSAGLIAAAIVLFGQKMNKELDVHLTGDNSFGWAMWLGVGGFAIVTITGLVFVIQGPSLYRSYKHRRS